MSKIKIEEKEFEQISKAIKSLKNGKFNISLESNNSELSEVIKDINEIANKLKSLNNSSSEMYTEVANGNLDHRIDSSSYKKGYGNILYELESIL